MFLQENAFMIFNGTIMGAMIIHSLPLTRNADGGDLDANQTKKGNP